MEMLCLTSFTYNNVFKVHPCGSMYQCFIAFLAESYSIASHCVLYPLVDGHLCCFHLWLSWIMLLWALMRKCVCGHMLSFLLSIYSGMELLGHMVNHVNFLRDSQTVIQSGYATLQSRQKCVMGPSFCGSVDWVPDCKPRGWQFNSQSGHMPG